jgi:hypothetical protein
MRRIVAQGQPGKIVHKTPISKITGAKWIGGVPQVVQLVLYKHKGLSLNFSPTKKGKEGKGREGRGREGRGGEEGRRGRE